MFSKKEFNHEFTMDMLKAMPDEKKKVLDGALTRSMWMTTYYGMDNQNVSVYKEGWYITFEGCRCNFAIWVGDNDGEFVFGKRKPREEKLSYLHSYYPHISSKDFVEIIGE